MTIGLRLLTSLCVLWLAGSLAAQQPYQAPSVPAKAQKEYEAALLLAAEGRGREGLVRLEALIDKHPRWLAPRESLGRLLYESGQASAAIGVLEASLAVDTISQLRLLYTLGRLYEETSQWDKAIGSYEALVRLGIHEAGLVDKATASLRQLDTKRALIATDVVFAPEPMPEGINTAAHEALGRWSLDGSMFIFTRREGEQEDLYFSRLDEAGHPVETTPWKFNTPQNEGAHAISPDGRYLVFTACNRPDGSGSCDLYFAVRRGEHWTQPRPIGAPINSPSWEGQPCFGLDGQTLFFSSSRPGGYGGRDIWVSTQRAPGKWHAPVNAGPAINTADDEESPFVHFDGRTLYFMRDGQGGLGGYDLYISRMGLDGKWMPAENMGAPINSGADEGALSLHPDGRHAVITRLTETTRNDLFVVELPEQFRAAPTQALQILLRDETTGVPVTGRVELFDVVAFDTVRLTQPTDEAGWVIVTLDRGCTYGAVATAPGYLPASRHLTADSAGQRRIEILMQPVDRKAETVLHFENIHFETGSAVLLPAAAPELRNLLELLVNHPDLHVEIQGHTDDTGEEAVNQRLSEARAQAVYGYLTDRGIDESRLTAKGFGEGQPIADNATEEGRRKNRRTSIRILSGQ